MLLNYFNSEAVRYLRYFCFIIFLVVIFQDCQKYEEGPFISCRSKKSRLTGMWDIEMFNSSPSDVDWSIKFHDNGEYAEYKISGTITGKWKFDDKKENVIVKLTILGSLYERKMEIMRLTNKEFWWESDGDLYQFKKRE